MTLKAMSDQFIDAEQPEQRCRKMYIRDTIKQDYNGLNEVEIKELQNRKSMAEWTEKQIFSEEELLK